MTKAEILTLVDDLSLSRADASLASDYLDEELNFLSESSDVLCQTDTLYTTDNDADYSLPDSDQQRIVCIFHRSRQLQKTSMQQLEAMSASWRTDTGTPIAFTEDVETSGAFRLYPVPTGETLITLITTVIPDAAYEMPDWLGFILAWRVLSREFARPSDHQDPEFADACAVFSAYLAALVKI